ncbi:MAG: tRNA sulfurtransferase [Haloarculaceae archaeon]
MHPPGADVVVVRHGEIGVKSDQVRRSMERQLRNNVHALLSDRDLPGELEQRSYRLLVHTDDPEGVTDAVTDAFGVVSASPAVTVEPTLPAIREGLADAARAASEGGTFAVRANRAGNADQHPFSSTDIEREGGAAVWDAVEEAGMDPEVDLDDPDLELFVDCRHEDAFVFLEKRAGPGGLPLGTQRPVVALVSGGIDSPVAAWHMMKRGCPVVPLYVDIGDYGGVDHRARAVSTAASLARYAPNEDMRLRIAPAGDVVDDIVASVDQGRMVALRRFMFMVAEAFARDQDAVGIVTGESVGQKSSQTSANLAASSAAVDLPVHRPLVGVDKTEITERAREIGTFEESTIPAGCERIAPNQPATAVRAADLRDREPADLAARAREVASQIEVVEAAPRGETA